MLSSWRQKIFQKYLRPKLAKFFFRGLIISLFAALLFLGTMLFIYWPRDMSHGQRPLYGLNFSQAYASSLGLNWQKTYLAILNQLKPRSLRIATNWNLIEKTPGKYDFSDLDWQIQQAQKRKVTIILAIGRRTPRWPECHTPLWAKNYPETKKERLILQLLRREVNHFKKYPNIIAWQVENEPLLNVFGECPPGNVHFLDKEVALVHSLDHRPVLLTDSGELSSWETLAGRADILGISMYRVVWHKYWGFFTYPFPPSFYYYKAKLAEYFHPQLKKVIITELQGEAWGNGRPLPQVPLKEQYLSMNPQRLKKNALYAQHSGLSPIYIWGAEWWYWLKVKKHDPQMWQTAQKIISPASK